MDKHDSADSVSEAKGNDISESLLLEQQEQMQEDLLLWKEAKKVLFTKAFFSSWLAIFFVFPFAFAWLLVKRNILPDPQIFAQHNILTTPGTAWFFAGVFAFMLQKIRKDKYWTKKSTVAALVGCLFGLIPDVQVSMVHLFYILVMRPLAFILSAL